MGTNYYIEEDICEYCGRSDEGYHIGKSSVGWCFSLHVDPDNGIICLQDVQDLWQDKVIRDEYDHVIPEKEMILIITDRDRGEEWERSAPFGYSSWAQFHRDNHSEQGPNGLLRHQIDGNHCIGHGPGTYDYLIGEFS